MESAVVLAILAVFCEILAPVSSLVRCYECTPDHLGFGIKKNYCENFDGSEKFLVQCPKSTMCYKKVVTMEIGDQVTTGVTRGCAPQTLRDEQKLENHHWTYTNEIHEVYEEKCFEEPNITLKPTKTIHCYCRGNHCNSAGVNDISFIVLLINGIVCSFLHHRFS